MVDGKSPAVFICFAMDGWLWCRYLGSFYRYFYRQNAKCPVRWYDMYARQFGRRATRTVSVGTNTSRRMVLAVQKFSDIVLYAANPRQPHRQALTSRRVQQAVSAYL